MKLIHFSGESLLEKYEDLAELKPSFQIFKNEQNLAPHQLLNSVYDVIELAPGDFAQFLPYFNALDIRMSRLLVADTLVRKGSIWHPMNLISDSVYAAIAKEVPKLKIAEPAVVIGEYDFVLAMSTKLAQSGFLKIIIALANSEEAEKIHDILTRFVFGIEIVIISLEQLTTLESSNGLLIINIQKEKYPEAHESITYFNFLSPNAVFADLHSRTENNLIEEARRAELIVVSEIEILKTKYERLLELV